MSFGGFGQSTAPAFGSSSNTFGAFGQQQQQPQQPATQQPTTGLFGQTQPSQQQPQTGGLFGANPTQNQTAPTGGTGLFGQNQQQQPPATGGLFGANTMQQQPAPGGGLFGQPQMQQQQPSGFGGTSMFGAATNSNAPGQQNPPGGGGLFGNTTTGNTGGGLFGNAAQNPQNQQQQPASMFGQSLSQNQPPAFGQQQQQQQQPPAGGLFGSTTAQPQTQQPSTSGFNLFGPRPTNPLTLSTLGPTQSTTQNVAQPTAGVSVIPSSGSSILDRVQEVWNGWDSSSPKCKFQHYFYNMVDPQQISFYGRPPNATNEELWQKALQDNPDPSRLVPVLALGFEDLKKRVDAQTASAKNQQQQLSELTKRLEAISQKHTLSSSLRAQKAAAAQTQLKQRITALVRHLHLLIPTVRSSSILPAEEALRSALENIDEELKRPGGLGRMKGKLNELWTAVAALAAMRERARKAGIEGPTGWAVVDEDGLNELSQILHNEQQGLAHLTKILNDDMADVEVIRKGIGESDPKKPSPNPLSGQALGQSRNTDLNTDNLFSFTLQVKSEEYRKTRNTRVYLCAASGDESGREALEWAIANLIEDGDELVVVRGFDPDDLQKDMHEQVRDEARELMKLILDRNSEYDGRRLSVIVEFVAGRVTEIIDRMTALYRPDSLVVGSRGSRSLMQTWGAALGAPGMGSVSRYCVSHSPVPVIVVRPERKVKKTVEKRRANPKRRAQFEELTKSRTFSGVAGTL
ncbi:hypothetical protein FRB99_006281 [Tulasnella sp. 403]|nr:hypothetical protein FRB99_006281 [Tulasnella sp. 403]